MIFFNAFNYFRLKIKELMTKTKGSCKTSIKLKERIIRMIGISLLIKNLMKKMSNINGIWKIF
jgi:hypothetical protein